MEKIAIEKVLPNPEQPRKSFDAAELTQLAASIRANGVIQPIVVEEAGEGFILHDGERRLRAAKMAGLTEIPAVVTSPLNGTAAHDRLLRALVANLQRADLNPIEEAQAFGKLRNEHGLTVKEIARQVGTYEIRVYNRLELLKLEEEIQKLIEKGDLPADVRVARALMEMEQGARLALAKKAGAGRYGIKTILTASQTMGVARRTRVAENDTPGVKIGLERVRKPLDLPAWDALAQVGRVPPWSIVEKLARRTCDRCALRPMASKATCGQCPLVQAIAEMVEEANAAHTIMGIASQRTLAMTQGIPMKKKRGRPRK